MKADLDSVIMSMAPVQVTSDADLVPVDLHPTKDRLEFGSPEICQTLHPPEVLSMAGRGGEPYHHPSRVFKVDCTRMLHTELQLGNNAHGCYLTNDRKRWITRASIMFIVLHLSLACAQFTGVRPIPRDRAYVDHDTIYLHDWRDLRKRPSSP